MDKTSVIVVSSCVALLGLNWWWSAQTTPEAQPPAATAPAAAPAQNTNEQAAPGAQPTAGEAATTPTEAQPTAPQITNAPAVEKLHTLISKSSEGKDVAAFTIQNIGGGVENVEMLGQAVDSTKPELGNVKINGLVPVGMKPYGIGTLMFGLSDDAEPVYDNAVYSVVGTPTATSVTVQSKNVQHNGVTFTVTKTYSIKPLQQGEETLEGNAYALKLDIQITNTSATNLVLNNWGVYGGGICQVNDNEGAVYTYYLTFDNGDFENESPGSFDPWFGSKKKRIYNTEFEKLEWAGLMNQYYATVIQPAKGSATASADAIYAAPAEYKLPGAEQNVEGLVLGFGMPAVTIAPNTTQSFSYETFTGPKFNLMLAGMTEEFNMIDEIMDYGWLYLISYPMNWIINVFHGWFGNWGWAIVAMTFVIRFLIWPLYRKSYMSMKRMSLLQPMIKEIKEKYGDNQQQAAVEMMALYKKYGISPMGGCLPMLLQIPIFFAFFYVLQTAAELRGAEFMFWVTDLSQPDTVCHIFGLPLNILPFIMAASMIAMMKMSPSAGDPMQQKIMKFMPLLFFLFCYTYPSALALYWTTTNIISIIQTLIIRRLPQPTLEEVKADAKGGNKKEGFFARIQRMAEEQQKALDAQKRQNNMRNVTKKKK